MRYGLAAGLRADQLALFGARPRSLTIAGAVLHIHAMDDAEALIARWADADWIIVHAAIAGPDRTPGGDLDRMRAINDDLLAQVMSLADRTALRRLVYMSSGAARPADPQAISPAKRAYGVMKREQEAALGEWSARAGAPLLIARLFNLGGPYMHPVHAYALGDFIDAVLGGRPIAIAAERPTFRSYVHVFDLARAIFQGSLSEGVQIDQFETRGQEIVELSDLAARVVKVLGRPELAIERRPLRGVLDRYIGDGVRWRDLMAGASPASLDEIILDTARHLSAGPP